jgi:hypothetical protein
MIGPTQRGTMTLPNVGAVLVVPNTLANTARTLKIHNRATKDALKDTMLHHWRGRWRRHFKATNRTEFDHAPRSEATKRIKMQKFASRTDLVQSGATKNFTTSVRPKFSVVSGGKSSGKRSVSSSVGGMTGRLEMRFPFPTNKFLQKKTRKDGKAAVTPTVMAEEMARWSGQDLSAAADRFAKQYAMNMKQELAGSARLRKKLGFL